MKRFILAVVLVLLPSIALAQSPDHPRNEVSGDGGWKAEWASLVAAAKTEGAVSVAGSRSPDARRVMIERWKKDFPDIEIQYTTGSSSTWVPKVLEERKAGKFLWDIFATGPSGGYMLAYNQALDPITPNLVIPELKDDATWNGGYDAVFNDKGRFVMGPWVQPATVWFDSAKVPEEKIKRLGLKVLLEPEYKGKIAWQDPRVGGPGENYSFFLHEKLGEEGLRKVLVDQQSVLYNAASEATTAVVRGKQYFVIGVQASTLEQFKKEGLGTSIKPMGTDSSLAWVGTGGMVLALMNRAAHPNAAKLFVNWMLTKEIQDALGDADRMNSLRKDVKPYTDGGLRAIPGQTYVNTTNEAILDRKKMVRELVQQIVPH